MKLPFPSRHGITLVEALTVIVILGIVLFITLPHLTQSKAANDLAAMKAKAAQLNLAKNAYISFAGLDNAQTAWAGFANDEARYQQIASYLPQGAAAAHLGSGTVPYVVPGFTLSFSQNSSGGRALNSVSTPAAITLIGSGAISY